MGRPGPMVLCAATFLFCTGALAQDEPGDYPFSFQTPDGRERTYLVHVPAGYDPTTPTAVVLAIHGGGGDAPGMQVVTGMDETSDSQGFLAVYPEGTGEEYLGKVYGSWNAGRCCPPAMDWGVDDVAYFVMLLDDLERRFNVDARRVFATGHSNGSQMTFRLACELSDRIAAVAPAGAQAVFDGCAPSRPVPVMYFHGTEDGCCPYEGGDACGGCFHEVLETIAGRDLGDPYTWACASVPDALGQWAGHNSCMSGTEVTLEQGALTCETHGGCSEGADVTLCTMDGVGHTWPGGSYGEACDRAPEGFLCQTFKDILGPLSSEIEGNELMWQFFQAHPMTDQDAGPDAGPADGDADSDADSDGDAHGDAHRGADGDADADVDADTPDAASDGAGESDAGGQSAGSSGGCGCRSAPRSAGAGGALLFLALSCHACFVVAKRRRR